MLEDVWYDDVWYDKAGQPIGWDEFCKLKTDLNYRRVGATTLPDGTWVSTVWTGHDLDFSGKPPIIFETMVFESESATRTELDVDRYVTLTEAEEGHKRMVAKWSSKTTDGGNG